MISKRHSAGSETIVPSVRAQRAAIVAVLGLVLGGCSSSGKSRDPGPRALGAGQTCDGVRRHLTQLDNRGVRSLVERHQRGDKLTAYQRSEVNRYNELLDQYLGARCHV